MILLSFLVQLMVVLTPMTSLAVSTENTLNEPMNKIQTYMSKQEVVIITDSYHIGDLKGNNVGIDAIVLYKPGMKTKVPGIRMSLGKAVKTEQVYYSYLDLDQIEGLSSAISSMIKLVKEKLSVGETRKDVVYSCKGGFEVALQKSASKTLFFLREKYVTVATEPENLILFKELLAKAQSVLNTK